MRQIIKKSLVTEKNATHNSAGTYVFEVETTASKTEIKMAVEKTFDVKVKAINTVNCRGRSKMTKQGMVNAPYWKKALVKLVDGQKIRIFEGV